MKKITAIIAVLAVAASLTACRERGTPSEIIPGNSSTSQNSSNSESPDQSSDATQPSAQDSSDNPGSNPAQDDYVMDKDILSEVTLIKDGLPEFEPLYATDGVNCKTLLGIPNSDGGAAVYGTKTGVAIRLSQYPNYHYIWIDADGKELDRAVFNFVDENYSTPDRDYPGTEIFVPSWAYGSSVYYYRDNKLQKNVALPKCHRADLIHENSQYLYIASDRESLTLYDLEKESAIKTIFAKSFGLGDSWVIDFVHAVTPDLATVTLLEFDPDKAGEYTGNENFRTFLLELPTLETVQKLPDATELTALDDNNFIMTKKEGKIRTVSLAKLDGEKLTEIKTDFTISEVSQFFNSSNIVLSPNKKVALLRDWVNEKPKLGSSMRCRAVSTNTMKVLWEVHASSESGISIGYPSAVVTDDAVLYMFNSPTDGSDRLLYRVSANG